MILEERERFFNMKDKMRKVTKNACIALKELGLSNREIAKKLDIPESRVRVAFDW